MARFRATIQGTRGEASRLGHAKTGMTARVNGWQSGVMVTADVENGKDVFTVWCTAGSNGHGGRVIGRVIDGVFIADKGAMIVHPE